jgi:hypothetical protein
MSFDLKYSEFYLRCATSAIFTLSGAFKATGGLNSQFKPFGYPKYFPEALGLFEVALAAVNVGAEVGLGPQVVAYNIWTQRIISVIMGGALYQHKLAGDGGYAAPALLLAFSAIIPGLRGDTSSLYESVGTGVALGVVGWFICSLIASAPAKPKSK